MQTTQILAALPHLTVGDRLKIAETALHLTQQDRQQLKEQRRQQMAIATMSAVTDYSSDVELIVFTDLDGEDFCDQPTADLDSANSDA